MEFSFGGGYSGPFIRPNLAGQNNFVINSPHLVDNDRWIDLDIHKNTMCGIKDDGSLWCWGEQESDPLPKLKRAGSYISILINGDINPSYVTLDKSGLVYEGVAPIGPITFKTIRRGNYRAPLGEKKYLCGISSSDKAYCQGQNDDLRLGVSSANTVLPGFVEVVGGGNFLNLATAEGRTCAIKIDKTLWCWGENVLRDPREPPGSLVNATFDLLSVGSPAEFVTRPREVVGVANIESIALTPRGSFSAIDSNGKLYAWGNNAVEDQRGNAWTGVLGTKDRSSQVISKPTLVDSDNTWKSVHMFSIKEPAHAHVTCAIKTDDTLWCWGYSEFSHIGVGDKPGTVVHRPTQVLPRTAS